ncbi:flagellar hook-length control protein FliK [Kineobactrum salinum]|uniref:Flagellar hook-length control protein-like C-terminal domain-containing protein n=1 Tax=Kineobactrum salinum TaxID=2708301 RepID=A0A6C0TWW3_9GAMM|nr:flagellar hook-length control protein FliK [Kineobactrum salinum]QIB64310.1 hypothetical protein G3T16_01720 [Kineobactrum salinum]
MSGITPILDTLLHQVLGKPVDLASARELNEPVRPMLPGTAPQAVHSDSRLDPRAPTIAAPAQTGSRGTAASGASVSGEPGQSSTRTHFSSGARAIADVLARFPAPPSVLRASAPLLAAGETPQPAELAARLKSSVDSSGLFYESHLQRWYKGSLPRAQLEREPQMQRMAEAGLEAGRAQAGSGRAAAAAAGPLPPFASGTAAGNVRAGLATAVMGAAVTAPDVSFRPGVESPTYTMPQVPATAQPGTRPPPAIPQIAVVPPAGAPEVQQAERSAGVPEIAGERPAAVGQESARARPESVAPVSEPLQSVVRQQLEMLAMPVLRWEGDVWSGVFMALMIQLPAAQQDWQTPAEAEPEQSEEEAGWRTELVLEIVNLGEIRVSLQLSEQRLAMTLASADPVLLQRLEANRDELETRLSRVGFDAVVLHLATTGERS